MSDVLRDGGGGMPYQVMTLSAIGLALTPAGGSVCMRLKSRISLRRAAVDILLVGGKSQNVAAVVDFNSQASRWRYDEDVMSSKSTSPEINSDGLSMETLTKSRRGGRSCECRFEELDVVGRGDVCLLLMSRSLEKKKLTRECGMLQD